MHFNKVVILSALNYLAYFDQFNLIETSILQRPVYHRFNDNWYPTETVNRKSGNGVITKSRWFFLVLSLFIIIITYLQGNLNLLLVNIIDVVNIG